MIEIRLATFDGIVQPFRDLRTTINLWKKTHLKNSERIAEGESHKK